MDTIRRLGAYGRTVIGHENYQKIRSSRTGIEKGGGLTYPDDSIGGYASSKQVATKIVTVGTVKIKSHRLNCKDRI